MLPLVLSALLLQLAAQPTPSDPTTQLDCRAVRVVLGAELAPWLDPAPAASSLRPGTAMPVTPGQAVTLEIAGAGTYGVAIDDRAWIEVTRDGQALRSRSHDDHGPSCTPIRKIVYFDLEPGQYSITLSRTGTASVRMLVFHK